MTKKNIVLSLTEARQLFLDSQMLSGINSDTNFSSINTQALKIIEHLGYIQIDTLSVVARAHHHTLWTRLPDYHEKSLNDLLENKKIFEYWSHAASYLPIKDYRYSLIRKKAYCENKSHWFKQDQKMKDYVYDRIKSEGALQSKDFEYKRENESGWFEWKPAKIALEQLFMEGKLMVSKRQGFQKVYDLTERVIPDYIDKSFPVKEEYLKYLIKTAIRSNGIVQSDEIIYLRNGLKSELNNTLNELLENKKIVAINIEGFENIKFFTNKIQLEFLGKIRTKNSVHFLSPFDNSVIQRKRLQRFFDFDYIIECYTPEPKRKYGYFTLPVLYKNRFIGRFDPKADRKKRIFYIKSMHFEEWFTPDSEFNQLFFEKLKSFADFNGCEKIIIESADESWKSKFPL